jgi:tetratricopeptide (TPR) repeat protein
MRKVIKETLNLRLHARALAGLVLMGLLLSSQIALAQADELGITEAEQAAFTRGQSLYNHGLYGEAIVTLNDFLAQYPSSIIKDLGLLWLGRCYLAQGDLTNAEKVGLRLKDIPDTPLASLYEDELRLGRQSFAKAASPRHLLKGEVTHSEPVARTPEPPKSTKPAKSPESQLVAQAPAAVDILKLTPSLKPTTPTLKLPEPVKVQETAVLNSKPAASAPVVERLITAQPQPAKPAVATRRTETAVAPRQNANLQPAIGAAPLLRSRLQSDSGSGNYRLLIVNEGNGRANDLTIRVELEPFSTYLSSDLLPIRQEMIGQKQVLTFRIPAVEAGEKKVIQISIHTLANSTTATPLKHSIFYKDLQGRFQHIP